MSRVSAHFSTRIYVVVFFVLLVSAAIIVRLFFLQVVNYSWYKAMAQRQQGYNVELAPKRGDISLRYKDGSLFTAATTQQGYLLYLDMRSLENPEEVFVKLNKITPVDRDLFFAISKKKDDPYEVLKQQISEEEGNKIRALELKGVELVEKGWRYYPGGTMASHVLGFVSTLSGEPEGKYGIEKYYETTLKGSLGTERGEKDAKGILIALSDQFTNPAREGGNVVLTIEPELQRFAEAQLKEVFEKWHATSGAIMVLEPKTGKIRALAAVPVFDPNEYNKEKNLSVFLNPMVEKIYELGSVFKPLTVAAALDKGVITPETKYMDYGFLKIGPSTIRNFDGKGRGEVDMQRVLSESLNTGAVFAMRQLGGENLYEYFRKYGLEEPLGLDLPGEIYGDLSNLDSGREIEYATASFGQGVAVTPLELAMALSSLGNGGKLMRPVITEDYTPQVIRQVLKKETSHTITQMLVNVVDTSLAGGAAKIPGYSIAAKTGTAQIPKTDGKGYSGEYLHSFFGYLPAYDPQFLIYLMLEKPQEVNYASHTLTDPFKKIVEFLINYYTIPPDRQPL
ncbi:penicillin-binding protein 2 [Candidatus Giovannonibacteria bacterium]|nr:penicillin-binding protein 2 [Candidatus Giovannonibacteria bacterium]